MEADVLASWKTMKSTTNRVCHPRNHVSQGTMPPFRHHGLNALSSDLTRRPGDRFPSQNSSWPKALLLKFFLGFLLALRQKAASKAASADSLHSETAKECVRVFAGCIFLTGRHPTNNFLVYLPSCRVFGRSPNFHTLHPYNYGLVQGADRENGEEQDSKTKHPENRRTSATQLQPSKNTSPHPPSGVRPLFLRYLRSPGL